LRVIFREDWLQWPEHNIHQALETWIRQF
jgi:hypothetical protein